MEISTITICRLTIQEYGDIQMIINIRLLIARNSLELNRSALSVTLEILYAQITDRTMNHQYMTLIRQNI
ncbi:hypothetical protein H70357_24715 [Paenibacillus sp. FSL H7-0357]|nr:hypothetical protein H70357_24715 [Paenibacillus sp. FSL H7-0357]